MLLFVLEVDHTVFFSLLSDINECSVSAGVCDVNANCQNTLGSYIFVRANLDIVEMEKHATVDKRTFKFY